jgi:hypothetical protein
MTKCSTCHKESKHRNTCSQCGIRVCDECTFVSPINGEYLCERCTDKDIELRSKQGFQAGDERRE